MPASEISVLLIVAVIVIIVVVVYRLYSRQRRGIASHQLEEFADAIAALRSAEYLPASIVAEWRRNYAMPIASASGTNLSRYLEQSNGARYETLRSQLKDIPAYVRKLNESFIQRRMQEDTVAFDEVEKFPLTDRQRRAIVIEENNTFVVAGAGTGKTSTIVGKVEYLTRRGLAAPTEVLVLAFGNQAANELRKRFASFPVASSVDASTFHALGRRIIASVEGRSPSLSVYASDDRALGKFISKHLIDQLGDSEFSLNLIRLFSDLLDEEENRANDGFSSKIQWLRSRGLRDLTDTRMKSRQEVEIANWLTLHGIKWEYERQYEYPTATPWKRAYQPDFYLTEHKIYLEHFGVDRNNRTAEYIDNQSYVEAMQWKRQLHQDHGTPLIATYSWMFTEHTWMDELRRQLLQHAVPVRPIRPEEARAVIDDSSKSLSDFVKLVAQFLSLYKSGNHTREQVEKAAGTERDRVFLNVFFRILDVYEAELRDSQTIDFNDMISLARTYVRDGQFVSPYRYIVVDEFQDISANRLGLIQDLRQQQPHSRVFVVGDDWQSIYRFTGSDFGIVTNLEVHLGVTERIDLDVAFRYPQPLLDVTSQFVMRNPAQLKKTLRAHVPSTDEFPLCVVFDEENDSTRPVTKALDTVMHEIEVRAQGATRERAMTVMMIGRYHFNRPENFEALERRLEKQHLKLIYTTAHGSKGKEADFVIIVGLESGERGFPSNISDDHVMNMVLTEDDSFPYGEERRLFYVAMTRTKSRTYLVVPHDNVSQFVSEELLSEEMMPFVEVIGETSLRHRCPRCKGQTIKRREGPFGTFWSCTNWPICLGKLRTCSECGEGALVESAHGGKCSSCGHTEVKCPRCHQGLLVSRTNRKSGEVFWACSNWNGGAGCNHTQNSKPYLPEVAAKELTSLSRTRA